MSESAVLRFEWKWLNAPTVRAAELRATWAELEIHAGDECVTLVEDRESRSARRTIFCPLYPLAEWIAFHWWFLQAHSRAAATAGQLGRRTSPARLGHRDHQRHNLRGAGDGFVWPSMLVVPQGPTTQLTWEADPLSRDATIRFLSSGQAHVDSAALVARLSWFVESVLARLHETGVPDTPLAKEWDAIQATSPDEKEFCLTAARLGLDPYTGTDGQETAILHASEVLPADLFDDFMDAVDPRRIEAGLTWVEQARQEIDQLTTTAGATLPVLETATVQPPAGPVVRPWEAGWEQARQTRTSLAIGLTDMLPIEELVAYAVRPQDDRGLHAFGTAKPSGASVVMGRRSPDASKRFVLARAAWHLVSRQAPRFLVTSAYTDRQRMERAYAAELLAPAQGIAEFLGDDLADAGLDEVEDAAQHFRVSPMIVQHQIENQLVGAW